jgi:hypothetical protein
MAASTSHAEPEHVSRATEARSDEAFCHATVDWIYIFVNEFTKMN